MNPEIQAYNNKQALSDKEICDLLATTITSELPEAESKIWHAHPVWFLDGNPVVGYSKLKDNVRLLFWSGQTFVLVYPHYIKKVERKGRSKEELHQVIE